MTQLIIIMEEWTKMLDSDSRDRRRIHGLQKSIRHGAAHAVV